MGVTDLQWMQQAYELAQIAAVQQEIPVGAVIVDAQDNLLGCGFNQVIQKSDPCAHAEIIALRQAAAKIANYRLSGATLYVTLEPCAMCAGALVQSRIARLCFGARDFRAGAAGSVYNLLSGRDLNHCVKIDEGLLQQESLNLLQSFFQSKRLLRNNIVS